MAVWGFLRKQDAEAASAIAKQRPPNAYSQKHRERSQRCWLVEAPEGGIPCADYSGQDETPTTGTAKGKVYVVDPADSTQVKLEKGQPEEGFDVINLGGEILEKHFVEGHQLGQFIIVEGPPFNLIEWELTGDAQGAGPHSAIITDPYTGEEIENPGQIELELPSGACVKAKEKGLGIRQCGKNTAISSASALLGSPSKMTVQKPSTDSAPGTVSCNEGTVCIEEQVSVVEMFGFPSCEQSESPTSNSNICFVANDLLECLDVCEYICENCDSYSEPEHCEPKCGTCDWYWSDSAQEWSLDYDYCDEGCECVEPEEPGTEDGERTTTKCSSDPPNCGYCGWVFSESLGDWEQTLSGRNCEPGCECDKPPVTGEENDGDTTTHPCKKIDEPPDPPPEKCGTCTWTWTGTEFNPAAGNSCTGDCVCSEVPDPSLGAGLDVGDVIETDCVSPPKPCSCGDCAFGAGGTDPQDGVVSGYEEWRDVEGPGRVAHWIQDGESTAAGEPYDPCAWQVPLRSEPPGQNGTALVGYTGNGWEIIFGQEGENGRIGDGGSCSGAEGQVSAEVGAKLSANGSSCEPAVVVRSRRSKALHAVMQADPELFDGCSSCGMKDAEMLLDRFLRKPSEKRFDNVVHQLHRGHRSRIAREKIASRLADAIEKTKAK